MKICVVHVLALAAAQLVSCEKLSLRGGVEADFGGAVLRELEEALGSTEHREQTEKQLHQFELELQTTFKALPKNRKGALESPYARYALHRLFAQRYGWQIKGLEMVSGAWYAGAGVGMMGDRVPPKMRQLFDRRLGNHGLLLHELAVLAATLDSMFRHDVIDRLSMVYDSMQYSKSDALNYDGAIIIADAYMATLIIGNPVEQLTKEDVMLSNSAFILQERYAQFRRLLLSTMTEVTGASIYIKDGRSFSFELMTSWLLEYGKQLGHLENKECQVMKHSLLDYEAGIGTGRVRLLDFHGASDHFEEALSDLRAMEALDETDSADPKVIIPNYLQGATNCISPAGYYSICCLDECEELMDKIEAHFQAPAASPGAIASFVASLPSATEPAIRSLPPELLELLELLATDRGGLVPLHSKRFAEWMHQAYPRECSHPQQSNADRFNQSLRHIIDDIKAEHYAIATGSHRLLQVETAGDSPQMVHEPQTDTASRQSSASSVANEVLVTCVMGVIGMALARLLLKSRERARVKNMKLL